MKQIYSLFAVLLCAVAFAQPYTETFDNYVHPGSLTSYFSTSFTGVESIPWTTVHARGAEENEITGAGIVLRRIEEGSALQGTFPNGLSQFSFQYKKAFTGSAERKLDVFVNGTLVSTTDGFGTVSSENATIYTYTMPAATLAAINVDQPVVVKIAISTTLTGSGTTNRQTTIDNIVWSPYNAVVVEDPVLTLTPSSLADFTYQVGNGPSAIQTFQISGTDLDGSNVVVTASADYEVSGDGINFDDSLILVSYNGAETTVHTRLKADLGIDTHNGFLMINGGGVTENIELSLSGSVTDVEPVPVLNVSDLSITDLDYVINEGPSPVTLFQITGTGLDGTDVTLATTSDFEMSLDGVEYLPTLILTAFQGEETSISVRLKADLEPSTYNGAITISGGGAEGTLSIALTGTVTPTASDSEFQNSTFTMYPNPVIDVLNFSKTTNVDIFNLNGKLILSAQQIESLDVTSLQSGFYLVKTSDGIVRKLIKK